MDEETLPGTAVFTIGHSNREWPVFGEMMLNASIDLVVDVRRFPKSRTNPSYNSETLSPRLKSREIGYIHMPALGGLRSKVSGAASEQNGFWQNRSFHNYADFALTDEFQSALKQLLDLCRDRRCALMCAEAVWWRCHRRIIADHLIARGLCVFHIMDVGKIVRAQMTDGAIVGPDWFVQYPSNEEAAARERRTR